MNDHTPYLSAQDVSLLRGRALVLDRVSVALRPGEVTAILGPNGAGKSSLLMTLAGLLAPYAGQVTLGNDALARVPARERARRIGYLPQEPSIAWDVAVEALVALGRLPHGDGGQASGQAAIEAALETVAMQALRARPASQLSGGERARVLLARVLAGEPDWILADEPFAALDLAHQLTLLSHLKECAARGAGVVIVVHDLNLAMNHADRVVILRAAPEGDADAGGAGRLVVDGAPETALSPTNIANTWGIAAQWLGEPGNRALVAQKAGASEATP